MFKNLVGSASLKNVIIVTTMWESVDRAIGETREEELKSTHTMFKPLIDAGAQVFRHDLGSESAHRIIGALLENTPKELLIQTELTNGTKLVDTSAGAELSADLDHLAEKDRKKLRDLEEELKEAIGDEDEELVAELQKELRKVMRRLKSREEDKAKLATNIHCLGPSMGARIAYRATGMKRVGGAIGAVGGATGLAFLAVGEAIEKCVGVPKEKGIATQVPTLVAMAEHKTHKYADAGRKHLGKPGALAGGALGATIGVTTGVAKGLGYIVGSKSRRTEQEL
jgi:hypothetical protein